MPDNKTKEREVKSCPWITTIVNNIGFLGDTPYLKGSSTRFGECLYEKCAKWELVRKNGTGTPIMGCTHS